MECFYWKFFSSIKYLYCNNLITLPFIFYLTIYMDVKQNMAKISEQGHRHLAYYHDIYSCGCKEYTRKIAIKNFAILQTGDLPAVLRCRRIFAPHRIGEHTARRKNGLRLVWQVTYQFPQKSMSIFGILSVRSPLDK